MNGQRKLAAALKLGPPVTISWTRLINQKGWRRVSVCFVWRVATKREALTHSSMQMIPFSPRAFSMIEFSVRGIRCFWTLP